MIHVLLDLAGLDEQHFPINTAQVDIVVEQPIAAVIIIGSCTSHKRENAQTHPETEGCLANAKARDLRL